jgi:hypothetical protein
MPSPCCSWRFGVVTACAAGARGKATAMTINMCDVKDLMRSRLMKAVPLAISCNAIITNCDRKFSKQSATLQGCPAPSRRMSRSLPTRGQLHLDRPQAARGEEPVVDGAAAVGCAAVPPGTSAAFATARARRPVVRHRGAGRGWAVGARTMQPRLPSAMLLPSTVRRCGPAKSSARVLPRQGATCAKADRPRSMNDCRAGRRPWQCHPQHYLNLFGEKAG